MYRKINIKILAIVFVVLLVVVVLLELFDIQKGNRTFRGQLVEVNADDITSIEIYPKVMGGAAIKLLKENDKWMVESDDKTYNADASVVGSLISELNNLKPESVVATSKDRWSNFEVTDSLGTHVKLFGNGELQADLYVGKFTFSQPRKMTSYIRLAEDKEVYGVDGLIGMSFNRNSDAFRDRTVIKSATADWVRLAFSYPADSSFTLEKVNDTWMIGDLQADSAAVAGYFNSIANLSESKFITDKPVIAPTHRLRIEGNNMMQPLEITGYFMDEENFVFESTENRDSYFNNPETASKIFVSIMKLIN